MRSARTSVFPFAAALAAPAGAAAREPELPAAITAVMDKPRYEDARWSLVIAELKTAKTVYALDPDRISFTDLDHNDANSLGTAILTPAGSALCTQPARASGEGGRHQGRGRRGSGRRSALRALPRVQRHLRDAMRGAGVSGTPEIWVTQRS
jgi:hypothetical protein